LDFVADYQRAPAPLKIGMLGDASNKDKLAEAMAKVQFTGPRRLFRFDPVTHNPIQNVYVCEEKEKDGRLFIAVIGTRKDVQAPPTKNG
jgi:branched-chain amino acid transport system substrate-binding protein